MPKIFEYLGIVIFFYSNEHDPVHVHGRHQGRENRAKILIENGKIIGVEIESVKGRQPLPPAQLSDFRVCVEK